VQFAAISAKNSVEIRSARLSETRPRSAKKICLERYMQFGCEGQASKIKPVALDKIAEKYKSGELAQIVR